MFTKDEREMIIMGLQMRRCFIQTGCATLSPQDVKDIGPTVAEKDYGASIKVLSDSQMQLCLDTTKLIDKITNM